MSFDGMENVTTESYSTIEFFVDENIQDVPLSLIENSSFTTTENMVNPTSSAKRESASPAVGITDGDVTKVNITGHLDSKVDIAHVWALWGVVIAAVLLVIVILVVLFLRCFKSARRSKSGEGRKPGKRISRFKRGTPKLPTRPQGVMADHKSVRKNFFHSLEQGDVQARREEATRRWLSGNLSTSLQYMEGSGSGGPQSQTGHECIPMYDTMHRHKILSQIPENQELQQEYAFIRSPRAPVKPRIERPILHRYPNDNVNEFARVIPLNVVQDQNANIALSPPNYTQGQYFRPRWATNMRPMTHSRVFPNTLRAISSEPPRFPSSRRREDRGHRVRYDPAQRLLHTVPKLPKFNLAGEAISSSEPSANGGAKALKFPTIWDELSFENHDNTVYELASTPTPRLVVPTNSPQTNSPPTEDDDDSSSDSQDSLNGISAGVSQCNVSSDASLTVTVGTSKRTSYEWDCYDPGYSNQPIRFVNGAYVPVIGCKQYWV